MKLIIQFPFISITYLPDWNATKKKEKFKV